MARSLAIMQPYFLPWIGYFQLIAAVNRFVCFDDVAFINRGWVNRNRIRIGSGEHLFTVPLAGASQNCEIRAIGLQGFQRWRLKFLKTLRHAYGRAPQFETGMRLIEALLETEPETIAELNVRCLVGIAKYLGLETEFVPSSTKYGNQGLAGQHRILDICRREQADLYINPEAGRPLYDHATFDDAGIQLRFLRPELPVYGPDAPFIPGLSIVDALMTCSAEQVAALARRGSIER